MGSLKNITRFVKAFRHKLPGKSSLNVSFVFPSVPSVPSVLSGKMCALCRPDRSDLIIINQSITKVGTVLSILPVLSDQLVAEVVAKCLPKCLKSIAWSYS